MSEELKQPMVDTENPVTEEVEAPAPMEPLALSVAVPTAVSMWNDTKLMNMTLKMAKVMADSDMIPKGYQHSVANCVLAIDLGNRLGMAPEMIASNLYMVQGKPAWSGQFCIAAINGCGRFSGLKFVEVGEIGKPSWGTYATAVRLSDGSHCTSDIITMQIANAEGWLSKPGSKWKSMPRQMMRYRAAAFFARVYCPDILMGYRTEDEVRDINGYEGVKEATVVTLENKEGG